MRRPCLRSGGGAVSLLLLLLGCVLCPLPVLQDPLPVEAGWICRPAARCSAAAVGRGRLPCQAPHAPALLWSAACCAPALMALQADLLLLCAVVRIKHPAPPEYLQPPAQEHRTQKKGKPKSHENQHKLTQSKSPEGTRREWPPFPSNQRYKISNLHSKSLNLGEEKGRRREWEGRRERRGREREKRDGCPLSKYLPLTLNAKGLNYP